MRVCCVLLVCDNEIGILDEIVTFCWVRVRVRVVIRAYEQVVLCACAACCWCATMRLVSWMKLSRFADEKLFGCG